MFLAIYRLTPKFASNFSSALSAVTKVKSGALQMLMQLYSVFLILSTFVTIFDSLIFKKKIVMILKLQTVFEVGIRVRVRIKSRQRTTENLYLYRLKLMRFQMFELY